jgi:hypothetical protein
MTQGHQLERSLHRFRTDVVLGTRTGSGLIDGLAGEHAEWDRDGERRRELGERSRHRVGQDLEVRGLTSDQAAKRHDGVKTAGSPEHRDGRRELERAGDLELLDLRAFGERHSDRPLGQRAGHFVVPARPHYRYARPATEILSPSRSLLRGGHLSQSSPRMRHCSVSE